MSDSEVITLMTLFHSGSFRNMKHFYQHYAQKHLQAEFPKTVSHNRFTELMQAAVLPMTIFLKTCYLGECTGISFVGSTPVSVYKKKRIKRNKVFKDIATVGKSTMGYFYGSNLHLINNGKGEVHNFAITQGNVDDREPLKNERFVQSIKGKHYGDKGYLSKQLTNILFVNGLHLISNVRNNMKNPLMALKDKILEKKIRY